METKLHNGGQSVPSWGKSLSSVCVDCDVSGMPVLDTKFYTEEMRLVLEVFFVSFVLLLIAIVVEVLVVKLDSNILSDEFLGVVDVGVFWGGESFLARRLLVVEFGDSLSGGESSFVQQTLN